MAINRFYSDTNSNTPTPLAGFNGFFTDLGSLPGPNTFNQVTPFTDLEIFDNVSKTFGRHTLKFGPQIRINRNNEWLRPQQTYDFASIPRFVNKCAIRPAKDRVSGICGEQEFQLGFLYPGRLEGDKDSYPESWLRYDYNTVWTTGPNQGQNFDVATQILLPPNQNTYTAPKGDWAPRAGFALDPTGKGKTVIHGYGGLFYNPLHFNFATTTNVPALSSYNVNLFQATITYPSPNPPLPRRNTKCECVSNASERPGGNELAVRNSAGNLRAARF